MEREWKLAPENPLPISPFQFCGIKGGVVKYLKCHQFSLTHITYFDIVFSFLDINFIKLLRCLPFIGYCQIHDFN